MTLVAKACFQGDVRDWLPLKQQLSGVSDADLSLVFVGREPDLVMKDSEQIKGAQIRNRSQLRQRHVFGVVGFEIVTNRFNVTRLFAWGLSGGVIRKLPADQYSHRRNELGFLFE